MDKLYLSERNLRTLLSKLERSKNGESTACTLVKYQNNTDPFTCSMDKIEVIAVLDEDFYANRSPGEVHLKDDPGLCIRSKD